jgi:hypothetical protein
MSNPERSSCVKRSASTAVATAIVELACLAALLGASPAMADSGWGKPVAIAGGGGGPAAVLTGGGDAAAVWEAQRDDRFVVEGAIRVAGKWHFESTIARDAFEPSVASLGEGEAVAVWAGAGVEVATATPEKGWSKAPPIPHSAGAFAPEVATDAVGEVTVVWRQPAPGGARIEIATRAAGGGWSAPRLLSRPGRVAYSPHLAVAPDGGAAVVWRREDGSKSIVQAAVRGGAGKWSAPVSLSAAGENAVTPAVAIDPAGEALATWQRFDGAHQIIEVSARRPGARWSAPVDLSARGRNAEDPQVALSATGEATVAWERFDGRVDRIQAATRRHGGGWSALRNLSGTRRSGHEPRLAVDGAGLARVVWQASEANGSAIAEASRPAGGSWSAPTTIIAGPSARREPTVAAAGDGEALAVWTGLAVGTSFRPPEE